MKPLADIARTPGVIDVTEDHHRSMETGLGQRIVRTDRDGSFLVSIGGEPHIKVMVSTGKGWDHVSVSLANRCPTWGEMSAVHRVCFRRTKPPCSCTFRHRSTLTAIRTACTCGDRQGGDARFRARRRSLWEGA